MYFDNKGPQDNPANTPYSRGPHLFSPELMTAGGGRTYSNNITATAGGGRAGATRLTSAMNRITVCATAGDSVALPPAVGGQEIVVLNAGTGACQVFADASTSDTINGVAAGTGVSLATATAATFYAFAPGTWAWVKSS
jgi:hypothetical protein